MGLLFEGWVFGVLTCIGYASIRDYIEVKHDNRVARTSWIYCPQCRRDLNGDNKSFVDDMGSEVRYTCATCKTNSAFDLDAPAPIYLGVWSAA